MCACCGGRGGGHASPAQRQAGINCQANGSRQLKLTTRVHYPIRRPLQHSINHTARPTRQIYPRRTRLYRRTHAVCHASPLHVVCTTPSSPATTGAYLCTARLAIEVGPHNMDYNRQLKISNVASFHYWTWRYVANLFCSHFPNYVHSLLTEN